MKILGNRFNNLNKVAEILIWHTFFTGQLPLNAFTYYFQNFLRITTSLVNFQLTPTPEYSHVHVPT